MLGAPGVVLLEDPLGVHDEGVCEIFCMNLFIYVYKMPNPPQNNFSDNKLRYLKIHPKWTIHINYSLKCVLIIQP